MLGGLGFSSLESPAAHPSYPSQPQLIATTTGKSFMLPKDYNNYNKMDNYSPGCAIGLGIVQIVIGVWFLVWGGWWGMAGFPIGAIMIWAPTILICGLFISSGSLAITARKKAHLKSSFAVSILSSITAFSLLLTLLIAEGEAPFYFFGLPALIMFIVATISAINSGIMVSYHLHIKSFPVSISDTLS